MRELESIRVVVFREGDLFIAQGLELDICAQGKSSEEAKCRFDAALAAEICEAEARQMSLFDLIDPAPAFFEAIYENGALERDAKPIPRAA